MLGQGHALLPIVHTIFPKYSRSVGEVYRWQPYEVGPLSVVHFFRSIYLVGAIIFSRVYAVICTVLKHDTRQKSN